MQVLSNTRRITSILKPQIVLNSAAASDHKLLLGSAIDCRIDIAPQCQSSRHHHLHPHFSSHSLRFSGNYYLGTIRDLMYLKTSNASFSTNTESSAREDVKDLYDKILQSVNVQRSMSPNAWLWSLIERCKTHEDIKLLFDVLHNLRRFRLSNLRIHDNFNYNLCHQVTKACVRVGAIDFAKKALWKHNVYGLTPNVSSANRLLTYAKDHNDAKLMVEVMKLLKRNNVPLQPGAADIVFSICYNLDNWELISKYSKRFLKAGVKLRRTSFDIWMDFAAKRGDTESLWEIEKLRSESKQQHTLMSAFSCAKGLIIEGKPQEAAAVIQVLDQTLPDTEKSGIATELQKLVSQWPLDAIKHQKEENRKALAAALKSNIPAMITGLSNIGLEVNVNLEELTSEEEIPC